MGLKMRHLGQTSFSSNWICLDSKSIMKLRRLNDSLANRMSKRNKFSVKKTLKMGKKRMPTPNSILVNKFVRTVLWMYHHNTMTVLWLHKLANRPPKKFQRIENSYNSSLRCSNSCNRSSVHLLLSLLLLQVAVVSSRWSKKMKLVCSGCDIIV